MNKLFALILLAAAAAAVPSYATGGAKAPASETEVKVFASGVNRWRMTGSIMGARNSADSNQFIGCNTSVTPGGNTWNRIAYCYARTSTMASTTGVVCSTSDPNLVAAVGNINETSLINIEYDQAAVCQHIQIINNSKYVAPPQTTSASAGML